MNSQKKNRAQNRSRGLSRLTLLLLAAALPILGMFIPNVGIAAETLIANDQQGNWIRVTDEPCPVSSGWLKLKKAEFQYQGKPYQACWLLSNGTVIIIDSGGDVTAVPATIFHRENKT